MTRRKHSRPARDIAPVHPHAAAVDIGATLHVAAVRPGCDPEPVRTFGTFTTDLHRLADWFEQCGVETVAMESTGVYWIPLYEILDQRGFEVVVVNARDAKHVPGRKTDVSDAAWLQRLHEYGLLRASFRPKGEIATLRSYLRHGQGQGGHRDGAQDRRSLLQHAPPRHGLRRSGRLRLRGTLPAAGLEQSPTPGQVTRIRLAEGRPCLSCNSCFLGSRW